MVYCEIPHEEGWTKGTNCNSRSLCLTFQQLEKVNANADCLGNQLTPHLLCDRDHEWQVEARVQALLEDV
jgi:hypothetical protein